MGTEPDGGTRAQEREQGSPASEDRDVRHSGGGRTVGETTVDEALGQQPIDER